MMKKITLSFLMAAVILVGAVQNSVAVPLDPEYEIFNGNPIGIPTYTAGTDLGYFIWADDAERRNWHIRWSGEGPNTIFTGNISMSDNSMSVNEFLFETHAGSPADWSYNISDQATTYFALANVHEDGLDITIVGDIMPSYIGFDLFMDGASGISDYIYIGAAGLNPDSQDFKIAAPVPEPSTIFLLGSGLVGLAIYGRRKKA